MNNNTQKKKLLILGGDYTECCIVKRAKALGYYTIVTDYHTDWRLSPAKQIADEGWDISWSDIPMLEANCLSAGVQGVLAGFSEFRVENMIRLCDKLHLPCSLTMHQLDVTRDKLLFKQTCRKYGIPTVKEHRIDDVKTYPVIIKPVDRAGSIGINVARNSEELNRFCDYAKSLSPSSSIIIEDFIEDGTKFDVYYYVKDGEIFFLGSSDTIMCKGETGAKILQKCWPFKSRYEEKYLNTADYLVREMFKGLGIRNTYATLSAFYQDGEFRFFETGFRLSGEMSYNYYEHLTGINYMDSMIRYAAGDPDSTDYKEESSASFSIVLNFFLTDGIVGKIEGVGELQSCKAVRRINTYIKEGDTVKNATDVYKKGVMVTIIADSLEDLNKTVALVNARLDVLDTAGISMIYERVTKNELDEYYQGLQ